MNEQPKQETLEEASENNYPEGDIWTEEQAVIRRLAFMKGAKWQQQQDKKLYSEEEVRNMLIDTSNYINTKELKDDSDINFNEWVRKRDWFISFLFEQFKKK
jgi:hypothetical protein